MDNLKIEIDDYQKEILDAFSIPRLIISYKEELQEAKEKLQEAKEKYNFYLKRCEMINKAIQKLES